MEYKVYWCKVNKFYLNKRITYLTENNQISDNIFLVATCVVTDRAKMKRVKEVIEKAKEGKDILIAGCWSITWWKATPKEDFFNYYPDLKPYEKRITLLSEDPLEGSELWFSFKMPWQKLRTKNYIIIQNGCDNHCSFCLTIFKRGPHRNRPLEEIIEEIHQIECLWGKEIVLTWINLAAWWTEDTRHTENSKFNELLKTIIKKTSVPRIRISSLDPQYLNDEFFEIVSNQRFCPHFHFSIQSFSDNVLKNMNRNYNNKQLDYVLNNIRNLNRPDKEYISIGADIITWFAWETEHDFEITCEGIEKYNITKLHAFPFSDHHIAEKIPASSLPNQVPQEVRKLRNRKIIEIWDHVRDSFIEKNYWRKTKVLIEEIRNWKSKGWTDNYIQLSLPEEHKSWELVETIITEDNCIF